MAAPTESLQLSLRVPLPSPGVAQVALGALEPDLAPPLPPPGGRARPSPTARAELCGETLLVRWEAAGPRGLRGGVGAFLELLGLVLETIESFGPLPHPAETPPPPH